MNSSDADCVVALSFGRATTKSIVDVNKEIADLAVSLGLPVIAQDEVADYIPNPIRIVKNSKGYIDTWSALANAKKTDGERRVYKSNISRSHPPILNGLQRKLLNRT